MSFSYGYYIVDLNKFFKELYALNRLWFGVRYKMKPEEMKAVFDEVLPLSAKMIKISVMLHEANKHYQTDNQAQEQS